MTSGFDLERFDAMALQLNARVSAETPSATFHVNHGSDGYRCASWRINEYAARELFVEEPGSRIAPFILRVGIYFQDAELATSKPDAKTAAISALTTHRPGLKALGVRCTFTPGSDTRDDRSFGWSDQDLTEWLTSTSDHRDLVWLWDLRKGEPDLQQVENLLVALHPVWLAWNALMPLPRLEEDDDVGISFA